MSIGLGMSKLAGFIGDIIGALFQPLGDFVVNLALKIMSFIPQLFYMIFACIAQICDVVQLLFRLLAGIDDSVVYINDSIMGVQGGVKHNFVVDILTSRLVLGTFTKMVVVALILLIIFTFVAIIKSEYSTEGAQNSKGKIIGKSLKALFTFLFIPFICIVGVVISNGVLDAIDGATGGSSGVTISGKIFVASAYGSNRIRTGEYTDSNEALKAGLADFNVLYNCSSSAVAADQVDAWFGDGRTVKVEGNTNASPSEFSIWGNLFTISQDSMADGNFTFSILDTSTVFYYYNLWSFNFIVAFGSIAFVTLTFLSLLLGLGKRAIELAVLLVISPPIIAVMPLDNGAMFGKWKTEFIKRVLNTYAPVVAMNLYFIIIPLIMNINVFASIQGAITQGAGAAFLAIAPLSVAGVSTVSFVGAAASAILNMLFQIIMMLAGAVTVKSSIDWISDLIGAENLVSSSKAVKEGTLDMAKDYKDKFSKGFSIAGKVGKGIGGIAAGTVGAVSGMVASTPLAKKIGTKFGSLGNSIAGSKFGQVAAKFGKGVANVATFIPNKIGSAAVKSSTKVKSYLENNKNVAGALDKVKGGFGNIGSTGADFFDLLGLKSLRKKIDPKYADLDTAVKTEKTRIAAADIVAGDKNKKDKADTASVANNIKDAAKDNADDNLRIAIDNLAKAINTRGISQIKENSAKYGNNSADASLLRIINASSNKQSFNSYADLIKTLTAGSSSPKAVADNLKKTVNVEIKVEGDKPKVNKTEKDS